MRNVRIANTPVTHATTAATASAPPSAPSPPPPAPQAAAGNLSSAAPPIAGTDIRNENAAASDGLTPRQSAATTVAPDREMPGTIAAACCGDPGFAARYLDGRASVRLDTADRIRTFVGDIPFRPVFLAEIEGFVELTGIEPWAVGHCATRQAGFVARLRAGASPWLSTMDRVRCWIHRELSPDDRRAYLDGIAEAIGIAYQTTSGGAHTGGLNGERTMTNPPKLMTTTAAADYLGLSPRTLERYRVTGGGPRFRKIGRWVRYVPADLANWLDDCARVSTSDDGRAAKEL